MKASIVATTLAIISSTIAAPTSSIESSVLAKRDVDCQVNAQQIDGSWVEDGYSRYRVAFSNSSRDKDGTGKHCADFPGAGGRCLAQAINTQCYFLDDDEQNKHTWVVDFSEVQGFWGLDIARCLSEQFVSRMESTSGCATAAPAKV